MIMTMMMKKKSSPYSPYRAAIDINYLPALTRAQISSGAIPLLIWGYTTSLLGLYHFSSGAIPLLFALKTFLFRGSGVTPDYYCLALEPYKFVAKVE